MEAEEEFVTRFPQASLATTAEQNSQRGFAEFELAAGFRILLSLTATKIGLAPSLSLHAIGLSHCGNERQHSYECLGHSGVYIHRGEKVVLSPE